MKQSRAEKKLDSIIEKEYYRQASGVQVSVMDIPDIFRCCRENMLEGKSLEESISIAIKVYRKN